MHLPFSNGAAGKLQWLLMYTYGQPRLGYRLLMATCCCGELKHKDLFEVKELSAHTRSGHFVKVRREHNLQQFACVGICVALLTSQLEIILVPQAGAGCMQAVGRAAFVQRDATSGSVGSVFGLSGFSVSAGSLFLLDCCVHARAPAVLSDKKHKTRRKNHSTKRD